VSEIVANCPRCRSNRTTFDVKADVETNVSHSWKHHYEIFGVCRHCKHGTILVVSDVGGNSYETFRRTGGVSAYNGSLSGLVEVDGYISLKDSTPIVPPDHLPEDIEAVFNEGAKCDAIGCFNAAGTMYRLCIDLATKTKLPEEDTNGLNSKIRRNLGLRLPWLFDQGLLPEALRELSTAIKDHGNDGAHAGTLKEADAADLLDFTVALLTRLYTEPERLRLAKERREARRSNV
jgi:hypothetical protein